MTKKSKKFKKVEAVHKFAVGVTYLAPNGQRFKVIQRTDTVVYLAPVKGCITYSKELFSAGIKVYCVTKSEQCNVSPRGEIVYLNCLKKVILPSKSKAVKK